MIDTETVKIDQNGLTIGSNMLTYDIGFAVVDKKGKVYESYSFVIGEIFIGESARMKTAYFADKIPLYFDQINDGTRKIVSFWDARKLVHSTIKKYNIKQVYAHNARFDYLALNATCNFIAKTWKKHYISFFPKDVDICDTLAMVRQVLSKTPSYRSWCFDNGYITNNIPPQPRATAEIVYRYISGDYSFVESHTGLEDVLIEKEIMAYCFRKHKPMKYILNVRGGKNDNMA